jgi:hypothetical protein
MQKKASFDKVNKAGQKEEKAQLQEKRRRKKDGD